MPIISILFLTETIYCKIFRCNYLRKEKYFRNLFLHFLNLDSILNIFQKKYDPYKVMSFWSYGLRKTWLDIYGQQFMVDICLKSPVSEDPSRSNKVNWPKHCWNLNDNVFAIFIHNCDGNLGWKSISEWYAKTSDCLLTHWLLMTNILFLTDSIYCNIIRCNYLRNEKCFLNLFFLVLNFD